MAWHPGDWYWGFYSIPKKGERMVARYSEGYSIWGQVLWGFTVYDSQLYLLHLQMKKVTNISIKDLITCLTRFHVKLTLYTCIDIWCWDDHSSDFFI